MEQVSVPLPSEVKVGLMELSQRMGCTPAQVMLFSTVRYIEVQNVPQCRSPLTLLLKGGDLIGQVG